MRTMIGRLETPPHRSDSPAQPQQPQHKSSVLPLVANTYHLREVVVRAYAVEPRAQAHTTTNAFAVFRAEAGLRLSPFGFCDYMLLQQSGRLLASLRS